MPQSIAPCLAEIYLLMQNIKMSYDLNRAKPVLNNIELKMVALLVVHSICIDMNKLHVNIKKYHYFHKFIVYIITKISYLDFPSFDYVQQPSASKTYTSQRS